ncbi:MAG: MATE family efflux transporter [Clostridia bacterium]|nr:MATE family efflux transporter [Clostridia bacterium]
MILKKFFGDKAFYKKVIAIALPIMIQNGITNFVNMLDNIMVGKIGTEQMTGVAITNQLFFVFNLCVFGGFSGIGIFTAQFFGKGDMKGVRDSMRFKALVGAVLALLALLIFGFAGEPLIGAFLHESESGGDLALTLDYGMKYLRIIMIGIIPFAITQMYSSTLRETNKTLPPMICGIAAVLVNLFFNYLLIFGNFGFPELGVEGAAIATVISRYVECAAIIIWTHKNKAKNPFIKGVYRSLRVPKRMVSEMSIKGLPLLLNEAMWSMGITMLSQCFSTRGLDVVGALNICTTLSNVFNIVFISLGTAISIMVGNLLGANKMEEARDTDTKLLTFTVLSSIVVGGGMAACSVIFPSIYNTTDEVKSLATFFIIVMACYMPMSSFLNGSYFTLRSGGKTWITFAFDSLYVWCVNVLLAFILTQYTSLSIYPIYIICYGIDILKCISGYVLVRSDLWMNNLVGEKN